LRVDEVSYDPPAARYRCLRTAARGTGPLLLVVGASFTAGEGAGSPLRAWSIDFARRLGWRAVIVGIPGIGYQHVGTDGIGPIDQVLLAIDPRRLAPDLVVIQAGHDDIGLSTDAERARARGVFARLHAELPDSTLAAITVFTATGSEDPAAAATDVAIRQGIERADSRVVVLDPLADGWQFDRSTDGLHPTTAGARRVAGIVAHRLGARDALIAARRGAPTGAVCDVTAGVPLGPPAAG
jgi:lysophospholipase L1-like esterase